MLGVFKGNEPTVKAMEQSNLYCLAVVYLCYDVQSQTCHDFALSLVPDPPAGFETTSNAISFTLFELAHHPQAQVGYTSGSLLSGYYWQCPKSDALPIAFEGKSFPACCRSPPCAAEVGLPACCRSARPDPDAGYAPVLCQTGFTLQAALAAELDAAELLVTPSRPQPRRLELSDLTKLTYLNALFKETQRLHPTAPLGTNRCDRQAACPAKIVQRCLALPTPAPGTTR